MARAVRGNRISLEALPRYVWGVVAVIALSVVYAVLQIGVVRPHLWPAGDGIVLAGDPTVRQRPLIARPPDVVRHAGEPAHVVSIEPSSPAAQAPGGPVLPGDRVLALRRGDGAAVDLSHLDSTDSAGRLAAWRSTYWLGITDPLTWTLSREGVAPRVLTLPRLTAWRSTAAPEWARRHVGMIMQILVFTGGAMMLLLLRSSDPTAALSVLALALSAVGGGGPLLGAEGALPLPTVMTVFAWMATPLAFPIIALAIGYFPTPSPLLARHRWLHAVPFLTAAPMIVLGLMTALYLSGVEAARGAAVWDAAHPAVYYASFAAALAINLAAIAEGVYRYRFNHDANERRRIRMAVYTAVPGVAAYALKDGLPIVADLAGVALPPYPYALSVCLQGLVLLPAFGLVYAVGVERVLGPRVVLRRSLQYALASRTLTILGALPLAVLAVLLVVQRDQSIRHVVTSGAGVFLLLIPASIAAFTFRDRARLWLDQRFFREEYDARTILLSLASRVRFETDPSDLSSMVVTQIDEALHPESISILVAGIDEGLLTPVTVLHGSAETLRLDGGLVAMLRWSEEPLEIFPLDPRSPVRRLPADEQEWLACTGAVLLVPVLGEDRALIAVIALGERRSEEAYTTEDRQLLASIGAQMGLGFDVARLRRQAESRGTTPSATTQALAPAAQPLAECTRCGRCEEGAILRCPADGAPMQLVPSVPRVVDGKYRIEQLLGRGGMGAVYRARDMRLDRLIALKVVRAELLGDAEARRRFRREAQIVARLQHPAIVAVYDYGTFADAGAYLVMELVRGEDLRRVLLREGRIDPDRAARILSTVCAAIEAAHREGVLHRDLKPENILLPGGEVEAKVLDFGVAKVITDEPRDEQTTAADTGSISTVEGMIIGTPAYMAPEQLRGAPPDGRTDVCSLGVIAYEMLSGELPFGRGSLAEVVLAQARGVPPMAPSTARPAVERAIRAALELDADRRPPSPMAFGHLVTAATGGL
ncbi:MAG: serine/threonine protein kinase [Acidobacteria bacterium]|nr:serine/threonine protein kinase [Acidobacteriota bacterium]